jgi:hypothetical protein
MKRVEMEYMQITSYNTENKVNQYFNIHDASIEIYQRVEDYQINRVTIKSIRKRNYSQVKKALINSLNDDIADKVINEYLSSVDKIVVIIDIHYDPLTYPLCDSPVWKLVSIDLTGINNDIQYLVESHNHALQEGWSPAICLRSDLAYFMSKYCKLLKYI